MRTVRSVLCFSTAPATTSSAPQMWDEEGVTVIIISQNLPKRSWPLLDASGTFEPVHEIFMTSSLETWRFWGPLPLPWAFEDIVLPSLYPARGGGPPLLGNVASCVRFFFSKILLFVLQGSKKGFSAVHSTNTRIFADYRLCLLFKGKSAPLSNRGIFQPFCWSFLDL